MKKLFSNPWVWVIVAVLLVLFFKRKAILGYEVFQPPQKGEPGWDPDKVYIT